MYSKSRTVVCKFAKDVVQCKATDTYCNVIINCISKGRFHLHLTKSHTILLNHGKVFKQESLKLSKDWFGTPAQLP